ncbi:hypothetical protein TcG_12507, partial [Trypanosoma cruzi]
DMEEEWRIRHSPAVKASLLPRVSRHCTASSGTISAQRTQEGRMKKGGNGTQIQGTRVHHRLAHRSPDGGHAAAAPCLWPVAAVDRGNDEREEGCDAVLIHLGWI